MLKATNLLKQAKANRKFILSVMRNMIFSILCIYIEKYYHLMHKNIAIANLPIQLNEQNMFYNMTLFKYYNSKKSKDFHDLTNSIAL